MKRLLSQILLSAVVGWCLAGNTKPITIGEEFEIESKVMGETRTVLVHLPTGYETATTAYPVLYMTDGQAHIRHTSGTVEFLATNGLMPRMIMVAITNTKRTRDLTPTHVAMEGRRANEESGGADRFLEFFEKELFPEIDKRYRTLPFRVFAGHSFGGTLAVHAYTKHPHLFNATIAVSPALNWDDQVLLHQAEAFFKAEFDGKRTLFVTLGNEQGPMKESYLSFVKLLKRQKNLNWGSHLFEDEDHGSVVLRSHYFGLKKVFDGWRPEQPFENLAQVQSHYKDLMERLGIQVEPPEPTVNLLGYRLLQRGDTKAALAAFNWNVDHFPNSANVYDSLGDGYVGAGQLEKAVESYKKAIEVGSKTGHPFMDAFKANYERAKQQLAEKAKAS